MGFLLEALYRLGLANMVKDADPEEYIKLMALTF